MKTKFIEAYGGNIAPSEGYRRQNTIYGLSGDTKPKEGVHNADIFYEMDTQMAYLYDESNSVWLEQ